VVYIGPSIGALGQAAVGEFVEHPLVGVGLRAEKHQMLQGVRQTTCRREKKRSKGVSYNKEEMLIEQEFKLANATIKAYLGYRGNRLRIEG